MLNATIAHVEESEKIIQENEDKFLNVTEKMRQSWIQMKTGFGHREEMDEHLIVLNAIIRRLITDITDIVTHLNSAKSGIINIRILPIETIINNLKEIAVQIPQGTHFPFNIAPENWGEIEKFIKISAYYDSIGIITIVRFSLIMYPTYEIIKAIPLPVHKQDDTFICIEVSQPIIAIDTDSRTYFTTTESELEKCMQNDNQYVCKRSHPTHHIDSQALCEVQTYVRTDTHTNSCNIRHIHANSTIWITLSDANSWIYSARKRQPIEITCSNGVTKKTEIKRSGRITIKEKCKLVTPDIIIKANKPAITTYINTKIPDYNLTNILKKQTNEPKDKVESIKLRKIIRNPSELMKLSNTLAETDRQINKDSLLIREHIIYPAISGITGTIIILSIVVLTHLVRRRKQTKKEQQDKISTIQISIPRVQREKIYDRPYQPDTTLNSGNNTAMLY